MGGGCFAVALSQIVIASVEKIYMKSPFALLQNYDDSVLPGGVGKGGA